MCSRISVLFLHLGVLRFIKVLFGSIKVLCRSIKVLSRSIKVLFRSSEVLFRYMPRHMPWPVPWHILHVNRMLIERS